MTNAILSHQDKSAEGFNPDVDNLIRIFSDNWAESDLYVFEKNHNCVMLLLRDIIMKLLKSKWIDFSFYSWSRYFPSLSVYNEIADNLYTELQKTYKTSFHLIDITDGNDDVQQKISEAIEVMEPNLKEISTIIVRSVSSALKAKWVELDKAELQHELPNLLKNYFLLRFEKRTEALFSVAKIKKTIWKIF
ncbi:MAG: hypothetical protein ACD_3C00191G0007 [uncultured bacterium (gcode 4)]|uniref:Uncharacterized protein n=1 Tax=uncultured bacterium (gcode 4) TaxID=1234023 RepID=K2F8W9_9BACT|nr:MAG: hypothetical protein ACD_3C00191G0007 [uncultured bacterium (gcode 4)]